MKYNERLEFFEDYIDQWAEFGEPIENGFRINQCSAIFIESGFNIHFGFYDPDGQKLGEYIFNAETGAALMIYDARYAGYRNECTSIFSDILGGLMKHFRLINKPIVVYTDAPKSMSFKDIVKEAVKKIIEEDKA